MFLDVFICRIDEKGRAYVPTKFREEFKDKDRIFIFKNRGYLSLRQKSEKGAVEIEIDKYWRFRIPKFLRKYGLQRKVVFVGCGDHIEIWSPEKWAEEEKRDPVEIREFEEFVEILLYLP